MADRTSARLFGEIFEMLAEEFPAGETRDRLAKRFWVMSRGYDFSDYQMDVPEALLKLNLAHMAVDPQYPEDGAIIIYEPPPGASVPTGSEGGGT